MIADPDRYIGEFAECGADIITFHLEAVKDCDKTIDLIHKSGCRAGISIKPATPLESLKPFIGKADMFLIMTVEPGFGGQKYIEASTEKIRTLRKMINESGCDTDIEVDGGIKTDNVGKILEAGANVIVSGSGVFRGNPGENVRSFLKIFDETSQ